MRGEEQTLDRGAALTHSHAHKNERAPLIWAMSSQVLFCGGRAERASESFCVPPHHHHPNSRKPLSSNFLSPSSFSCSPPPGLVLMIVNGWRPPSISFSLVHGGFPRAIIMIINNENSLTLSHELFKCIIGFFLSCPSQPFFLPVCHRHTDMQKICVRHAFYSPAHTKPH